MIYSAGLAYYSATPRIVHGDFDIIAIPSALTAVECVYIAPLVLLLFCNRVCFSQFNKIGFSSKHSKFAPLLGALALLWLITCITVYTGREDHGLVCRSSTY